MRNKESWHPTKFVYRNGHLRANSDRRYLSRSSRLVGDRVAFCYGRRLEQYAKGMLVDLGCGCVPLYEAYKDYIVEAVCVDWPHSLHAADHIDFACDLNRTLPFVGDSFDTCILSDVLEHLSDPSLLWSELSRITRQGGHVILNVPFFYWLHETPHDYFRYTEFALRRMAVERGFEVVLIEPVGGAFDIVADICAKHLAIVPRLGGLLAVWLQSFVQLGLRTNLGKRLSLATQARFPLGYFMVARKT